MGSVLDSVCFAAEDSDTEAFGVELEEDEEGLSLSDLPESAILASFRPAESGASSKVSWRTDMVRDRYKHQMSVTYSFVVCVLRT